MIENLRLKPVMCKARGRCLLLINLLLLSSLHFLWIFTSHIILWGTTEMVFWLKKGFKKKKKIKVSLLTSIFDWRIFTSEKQVKKKIIGFLPIRRFVLSLQITFSYSINNPFHFSVMITIFHVCIWSSRKKELLEYCSPKRLVHAGPFKMDSAEV